VTDGQLIRRIQAGDAGSFQVLIEKYYDEVFGFCCYRTGDREAAYDCTQETFLKVTKYIWNYQEQNKFKGYLFSIARNVCNDYFRGKHPEYPSDDGMENVADQKDFTGNSETAWVLQEALHKLPPFQREVIVLKYYHGFKIKEIADQLSIPMATAKSRLRQGMIKLKGILEQGGSL
jgi:RNA polymerase sigma factor (sigma-70 family)